MAEEVRLYDIRGHDYPHERGDSFRGLQVFECWICGALTNLVVMGGYPGYGIRAVCPNSYECWHHALEDKLRWLGNPHPKSYKKELRTEIEAIKKRCRVRVKNDIVGKPDFSLKRGMTNVRGYKDGKTCKHWRF